MTNTSDSSAAPEDSPEPTEPPGPKRGAFPTPKSEIENAQPYIPDIDEKENPDGESGPPDVAGEKEDQRGPDDPLHPTE
jgi:hypothetical protein